MTEPQGFVSQMLSVSTNTITGWELNRNTPQVKYIPRIINFLGYTPLFNLAGNSLSKRLKQFMYVNGLSQKECAKKLGVDPATIQRVVEERDVHKTTRNKLQNRIVFQ